MKYNILILVLFCIASIHASLLDHSILDELDAITEETPSGKLKEVFEFLSGFKNDIKELKELSDRTQIKNQLSALAFYQDFVVNTNLTDWNWLCHEFLTEDVNMTVYTTNGTYQFLGCQNVTKFYTSTVSGLWNFIYHPYANPWVELFTNNGTANTLVSGMNNAVMKTPQGNEAAWTFNYYSFGWVKTWRGWRIKRFTHLSTFTVPYQGVGWANIPVPFTTLYDLILQEYPILGKHFHEAIQLALLH